MAKRRRQSSSSGPNSPDKKRTTAKSSDAAESAKASESDKPVDPTAKVSPTADDSPEVVGVSQRYAALPPLSRILSIAMLILGIVAVGALFYRVMAGFFVPLFLAALLVVIFRPVHQWLLKRLNGRKRIAALATTATVLVVVLMPVIFLIFVATSQFTAMISHVDFDDISDALDRTRDRIGISLPHAEKFRRLDQLADTLNQSDRPDATLQPEFVLDNITEATMLIDFLQEEVESGPGSELAAEAAEERLQEFAGSVQQYHAGLDEEPLGKLAAEEQFHRQSVIAAAAIRSWMRTLLGGTFLSQVRLIANPSAEDFKELLNRGRESLQPRFVRLTSATGSFLLQLLIGLVVLIFAVYFFLIDGPAMIHTLMRLSPLDDNYEERLLLEFDRTSRAVVLASVLSAVAQGFLAAIAFYFLGFDSVILLFLLTSLMALVPFLGAAAVWVPCAIYLAAVDERYTAAIFLAIYGAAVVSSIDNVIKMFVLHGRSTLHPLLALLSVLGGVKVFGPIGILVGPMVVVFLQTLLEILNHELGRHHDPGLTTDETEATAIATEVK